MPSTSRSGSNNIIYFRNLTMLIYCTSHNTGKFGSILGSCFQIVSPMTTCFDRPSPHKARGFGCQSLAELLYRLGGSLLNTCFHDGFVAGRQIVVSSGQWLRRAIIVARERSIHREIRSSVCPMSSRSPDPTLSRFSNEISSALAGWYPLEQFAMMRVHRLKTEYSRGPYPLAGSLGAPAGTRAHASSRSRDCVRHAASASVSVIALRFR